MTSLSRPAPLSQASYQVPYSPPVPQSIQRVVGLSLIVVGIVCAVVGLIGAQSARSSNEDAVYDAEISCIAAQIVQGRAVACEQPEPNYGPWILVGVVGGVLFLAGAIVAATGGSTSTPTTASSNPSIASPRPLAGGGPSAPPTPAETAVSDIRKAATTTSNVAAINAALDRFVESRVPAVRVRVWALTSGRYCVLLNTNGLTYMLSPEGARSVPRNAIARHVVNASGQVVRAVIDGVEFRELGPASDLESLLRSLGSVEFVVDEPSSAEEPTQPKDSIPTMTSADPQRDMTSQLRELADLHAAGQLTDAEFTTAKTRVIQGGDS